VNSYSPIDGVPHAGSDHDNSKQDQPIATDVIRDVVSIEFLSDDIDTLTSYHWKIRTLTHITPKCGSDVVLPLKRLKGGFGAPQNTAFREDGDVLPNY
jgi:hypothetical protein